jgi:hypothetical protein
VSLWIRSRNIIPHCSRLAMLRGGMIRNSTRGFPQPFQENSGIVSWDRTRPFKFEEEYIRSDCGRELKEGWYKYHMLKYLPGLLSGNKLDSYFCGTWFESGSKHRPLVVVKLWGNIGHGRFLLYPFEVITYRWSHHIIRKQWNKMEQKYCRQTDGLTVSAPT